MSDPRARYLKIAAHCFARDGFHGASLAAVAKEAGVTKQALLHFFGTKERLYAEVLTALAERLIRKFDEVAAKGPEARLIAYFDAHAAGALAEPEDARLVVRALLEGDASARMWPMKPYLDRLVDAVLDTARWRGASREAALAGVYQVIGAIQYAAISAPALTGMYGEEGRARVSAHLSEGVRQAVRAFIAPA